MIKPISIISLSSLSALGEEMREISSAYFNEKHYLSTQLANGKERIVGKIKDENKTKIQELFSSNKKYKNLDETVLNAIFVSREAIKEAHWENEKNIGVNIGSSRGATQLFEKYHHQFIDKQTTALLSSPNTTLGNISSWVAQDIQTNGPEISHSITCSTGLHAVLNGVAWLSSGMSSKFIVGASEAALTDFTLMQLEVLKIYSKRNKYDFPCLSSDLDKKENTMVLGEAAAVLCLESGLNKERIGSILGVGFSTEKLEHNTSLSSNGDCIHDAMKSAIKEIGKENIDAIITHAPGTIKGDKSEFKAIKRLFGEKLPFLTNNKWKLGHTFATSGILNIEMALLMLKNQKVIHIPYIKKQTEPKRIKNILVNAVGFGGNAVSILISK